MCGDYGKFYKISTTENKMFLKTLCGYGRYFILYGDSPGNVSSHTFELIL